MRKSHDNLWPRRSAIIARIIVRLWPDQTKSWGQAFAAELPEITSPLQSTRWLIGGLMLLTRERFKSFFAGLRRPFGVPSGSAAESLAKNSTRVPSMPRWATMLLLLASAGILLHPEVRSSLRNIVNSYTDPTWDPSHWRGVKQLRKVAANNRDPQLLAVLSLLSTDEPERLRLSEEAIENDPSLTWLDYEQSLLPLKDVRRQHYLPAERLARLQQWDPDNAVLQLLSAEMIAHSTISETRAAQLQDGIGAAWETHLLQDPRWLAAMECAFVRPKYDSYSSQALTLVRAVSKKYGVSDIQPTIYILSRQRLVDFVDLRAYTNYRMQRAAQAEHQGNLPTALSTYWQVVLFSERMMNSDSTDIDKYIGQDLGMKAGDRLQPLLERTGHDEEAALLGFQLAEWHAARERQVSRIKSGRFAAWDSSSWTRITFQLAASLVLLLAVGSVVSQAIVWLRRRKPVELRGWTDTLACRVADFTPLLLLLACAALFVSDHSYAQAYKAFLNSSALPTDIAGLFAMADATRGLPNISQRHDASVYFWSAATATLSLAVAFLIFRILFRRNPAANQG
jgi:hypothetical protein